MSLDVRRNVFVMGKGAGQRRIARMGLRVIVERRMEGKVSGRE